MSPLLVILPSWGGTLKNLSQGLVLITHSPGVPLCYCTSCLFWSLYTSLAILYPPYIPRWSHSLSWFQLPFWDDYFQNSSLIQPPWIIKHLTLYVCRCLTNPATEIQSKKTQIYHFSDKSAFLGGSGQAVGCHSQLNSLPSHYRVFALDSVS